MRTEPRPLEVGHGTDDRLLPGSSYAHQIVNFRWDPRGWWVNDRGWEPQIPRAAGYEWPKETLAPIRGLWIYTRHQGAEVYYLFERGGRLQYEWGNDNQETSGLQQVILQENRHIPGPDDPGTQIVPFGRFALLLNGTDQPVKFFGGSLLTPYGFDAPPAPPVIQAVDPDILANQFDPDVGNGTSDDSTALAYTLGGATQGVVFLGDPAPDSESRYLYRVRYVSETGSVSPASPEVEIRWKNAETILIGQSTFAVSMAIPVGPDHVVARLIERTKNLGDGTDLTDRTFYSVAMIPDNCSDSWVDTYADGRLSIAAPDLSASVSLPPGLRFGAAFDGRMWVGGGSHCPTRVLYSERNAPEQFPAFNFFDLGGSAAGELTAIVAHEGRLYLFRARGIDVIEQTQELEYRQGTISSSIGTTATNTIRAVPGFGLVFLSRDGVYAISGLTAPVRLSDPIADELSRIGAGSLARATADWSSREGEWWCQYPADGAVENLRGVVLHAYASAPDHPAWSLRHVVPTDVEAGRFRSVVTAIAADPDGWFVFGTSPLNSTSGDYPGTETIDTIEVADVLEGSSGLQVWSARPAAGTSLAVATILPGEGYTATQEALPALEAVWQSPWIRFDPRAVVPHVDVWFLNTGRPELTMEYAVDGRADWITAHGMEIAPAETAGTSAMDHVYTEDPADGKRGFQANWSVSRWREDRLVRVRWSVQVPAGACGSFSFRLRSTNPIGIVQYQIGSKPGVIRVGLQNGVSGGVG